ncbi:hypothetical protein ACVWWG_006864 [Bradyrhizobium sp. LB7.2]
MRTLSLILAFGFVLAGSSFAGSPDGNLPGVGTFRYRRLANHDHYAAADRGRRALLIANKKISR